MFLSAHCTLDDKRKERKLEVAPENEVWCGGAWLLLVCSFYVIYFFYGSIQTKE